MRLFWEMCVFWENVRLEGKKGVRIIGNVLIMCVLIMSGDSMSST